MAESRQGTQVIAVMWNGKCVGKLFERMEQCPPPCDGITAQSWEGDVLGEHVRAHSVNEAFMNCRSIFREKGMFMMNLVADDDYPVIVPAFEE